MLESALPSLTLNVNESDPLKFGAGVKVRSGAVPDSTPFVGWVTTANDKVSPTSGSVPPSTNCTAVSSSVVTVCGVAVGVELGGAVTVRSAVPAPLQLPATSTARTATVYVPGARVAGTSPVSDAARERQRSAAADAGVCADPPLAAGQPGKGVRRRRRELLVWAASRDAGSSVTTGTVGAVRSTFTVSEIGRRQPGIVRCGSGEHECRTLLGAGGLRWRACRHTRDRIRARVGRCDRGVAPSGGIRRQVPGQR